MRLKAEWAIDSEPFRARGKIVDYYYYYYYFICLKSFPGILNYA